MSINCFIIMLVLNAVNTSDSEEGDIQCIYNEGEGAGVILMGLML